MKQYLNAVSLLAISCGLSIACAPSAHAQFGGLMDKAKQKISAATPSSSSGSASVPASSAGAGRNANAQPGPLTDRDKAVLIDYAKEIQVKYPSLPLAGVDVASGSVRVTGAEQTEFSKELNLIGTGADGYNKFVASCKYEAAGKPKPKIIYDAALAKAYNWNRSLMMYDIIGGLEQACGNPPNTAVQGLVQGIATIHYELGGVKCSGKAYGSHNFDATAGGFAYIKLDDAAHELHIGMCTEGQNEGPELQAWIKEQ